jgi:hypothetical protein
MAKGYISRMTYSNWLWVLSLLMLVSALLFNLLYPVSLGEKSLDPSNLILLPGCINLVEAIQPLMVSPYFLNIFSVVTIIIIAFLIHKIAADNRLIRVRSFYPFSLFIVLCVAIFSHIIYPITLLSCLFLTLSIFRVFAVVEKNEMNRAIFDASFLLGIASLGFNNLVFFTPFFWLASAQIQSLSFRNVIASIIGFLTIYWFIAGASVLLNDYRYLLNLASIFSLDGFVFFDVKSYNQLAVIFIAYLGLLMIITPIHFFSNRNLEKLRVRNHYSALLIIWIGLCLTWLFSVQSQSRTFVFLLIPIALFYAHYFSLNNSLFTRFLIIVLLGFIPIIYFFY